MRGRYSQPQGCGRGTQPDRTPDCARRTLQGHQRRAGKGGRGMARLGGAQAARTCAGQGHRRLYRRRYRGNATGTAAPDRGDRRPADGRDERRRRSVRVGQDVSAAGREIGARDEEGGRAPAAFHRGGERTRREGQGQGRDGDREGRRPRHRQEYRRRGAPVQRVRDRRSGRDGAVVEDSGGRERE